MTFYESHKANYKWVADHFKQSKTDGSSWDIETLAKELDKHFEEMRSQLELEYLKEDVEWYVDDFTDHELTDQQLYNVADRVRKSDWYHKLDRDILGDYVEEELAKGE